jgi:hypothetical protein
MNNNTNTETRKFQLVIAAALAGAALGGALVGAATTAAFLRPEPHVVEAVVDRPLDISCDTYTSSDLVECVDGYSGTVYATYPVATQPGCWEDEVLAPIRKGQPGYKEDALSWGCINAEDYIAREG